MNPRLYLLLALCGATLALAAENSNRSRRSSSGSSSGAPAPTPRSEVDPASFDAFKIISDRNIFNSVRTGRRDREERGPRVESLTLVGTMDYDKGLFAFFDGSESSYRKALHIGDSVAQFKVTKIRGDGVELERDGKSYPMQLAQQLRRPEGGEWTLIAADIVRSEATAARAAEDAKSAATAANVIPADADPVLRRLMEQRQKSLKQ